MSPSYFDGKIDQIGHFLTQPLRILLNIDILSYEAPGPKYEIFACNIWWFYIKYILKHDFPRFHKDGQKLARKFSFSLYNIQFNSSDSLNRMSFVPNLVFFYSLGTTAMVHGQITNLKFVYYTKIGFFFRNLSPTP